MHATPRDISPNGKFGKSDAPLLYFGAKETLFDGWDIEICALRMLIRTAAKPIDQEGKHEDSKIIL